MGRRHEWQTMRQIFKRMCPWAFAKLEKKIAEKGFSLIELMIVLVIFLFAGVLFYGIFVNQYRFITLQQDFTDMDLKMTQTMQTMALDVALTGADPRARGIFDSGTGNFVGANFTYPIASFLPIDTNADSIVDQIRLRSDRRNLDGEVDGDASGTPENILYRLDTTIANNGRIRRNGIILADRVASMRFKFRDFQGNTVTNAIALANPEIVSFLEVRVQTRSRSLNQSTNLPYTRDYYSGFRMVNR